MMKFLGTCCVAAMSLTTTVGAATFSDRASFLADSGDFLDHTGTAPRGARSAAYSNGLTVSTPSPNMGSASLFGSHGNGISDALLVSGHEHLDFQFTQQRYGFGLSIFDPVTTDINGCNTSCRDSVFTFTFLNGGSFVATETFNPVNAVKTFFGVTLSSGFDRVEMRETTGGNDNEFFGEIVSTAKLSAPSPVPLPATGVLLFAGVAGAAALRRRC